MIRQFIGQNSSPALFLVAYFFTIVLGNLIYASPFGPE